MTLRQKAAQSGPARPAWTGNGLTGEYPPMSNPACPVTGEPAARLVQWINSDFLVALWRIMFKVDARPSLGPPGKIGLWESQTGLYFFDPMPEGDQAFYRQFYERLMKQRLWFLDADRHAFALAARRIAPGDRVLDVGCGFAFFRTLIPQAAYVGLDPNFGGVADVRQEMLSDHLGQHSGAYDAVCAFEVLEHLASPAQMFADMVRAARPGGLVIVSVPHVPSALTRIPNFVFNAPPHHLTWWTEAALRTLAEANGASVQSVERTEWGAVDSLIYWMARCTPIECGDMHFRGAMPWHAAALAGYLAGRLIYAVNKSPKAADEGAGLVMVARRGTSAAAA
jgi:SAM-dependent methyltransferase